MIPSDLSVNMHRLDYGTNVPLDMRGKVAEAFQRASVAPTSVLPGAFPECFPSPFHEVLAPGTGAFSIWGDGVRSPSIRAPRAAPSTSPVRP
jgi:hypothetical protein